MSFPGWGWHIAWSPDSTRLATWVEPYESIGIYGIDGVRQALLTLPDEHPMRRDFDPCGRLTVCPSSCRWARRTETVHSFSGNFPSMAMRHGRCRTTTRDRIRDSATRRMALRWRTSMTKDRSLLPRRTVPAVGH